MQVLRNRRCAQIEGEQMNPLPTHHHLENAVQLAKGHILGHLNPAPNHRAQTLQPDLELQDVCGFIARHRAIRLSLSAFSQSPGYTISGRIAPTPHFLMVPNDDGLPRCRLAAMNFVRAEPTHNGHRGRFLPLSVEAPQDPAAEKSRAPSVPLASAAIYVPCHRHPRTGRSHRPARASDPRHLSGILPIH